jgi:translation initiation factor 2 alpha subunit (eIF-2alpha)
MNNTFKNAGTKKIKLDEEFSLTPDSDHGLVLTQEVVKIRKKIDKETKKPNGEVEDYLDVERHYFPRLAQSINKYIQLTSNEAESITELKEILLRIEKTIEEKLIFDFK